MNVCCTLAFWFSLLSDSSDTNNRQAKEKPTGRPKPPAAKEQNFGSGSDRLSVICQKRCEEWSCGDKQATVCLVSVKVRHRIVWHKNKNRSIRAIPPVCVSNLCFSSCVCFAGDYFGILLDEKVTVFPFNIMENPMYWGSTANYLGLALM